MKMKASGKPNWKRLTWRVVRMALIIQVTVMLFFYFQQDRLVFQGKGTQGQPFAIVKPPSGSELIHLVTAKGDKIVALFGPALTPNGYPLPNAARRPTLLYFYGTGGCLNDMRFLTFYSLRCLGFNVLIPEYVGYGMSEGDASEANCYATADAAYDYLRTRKDIDPRKIVAVGWSLGGAMAIDLAARRPVQGLATFSTFTCILDVAHSRYILFPLDGLVLRSKFESESKIGRVRCPIFLAHGTEDTVVPFAMLDRLQTAAKSPVTSVAVGGADHFDLHDGGKVRNAFRDFVNRLP